MIFPVLFFSLQFLFFFTFIDHSSKLGTTLLRTRGLALLVAEAGALGQFSEGNLCMLGDVWGGFGGEDEE